MQHIEAREGRHVYRSRNARTATVDKKASGVERVVLRGQGRQRWDRCTLGEER